MKRSLFRGGPPVPRRWSMASRIPEGGLSMIPNPLKPFERTSDLDVLRNVTIVVVLFHPSEDDLANVVQMAAWGCPIVVVINAIGGHQLARIPDYPQLTVIANRTNLGLARALNQGLRTAIEGGAPYVLMLDQDSRPTVEMLVCLVDAAGQLERVGKAVACVAPALRDLKIAETQSGDRAFDIVGASTFATSGTLITRAGWQQVGAMWEDLFIDGIDHEWCFRAKASGLEVVAIPRAVLVHDMGESAVKVLGRFRPIHRSPTRHYFIVRNTLWLARLPYIPLRWRLGELVKLAYRVPTYLVLSSRPGLTALNVMAAIVDGFRQTARLQPVGAARRDRVVSPCPVA